ncbi:MAG: hypothetical protein ABIH28_00260 [archaeon]
MSYNQITCEYYDDGMCIYVNHRLAIFEKCQLENLSKEIQIKYQKDCIQKRTIERIRESELEQRV